MKVKLCNSSIYTCQLGRFTGVLVGLAMSSLAASQAAENSPKSGKRKLEEVVVTAQKVEQFQQDVPISMSVMSDEFVRDQGITDLNDALKYVPNFKVVEFFGKVSPQCRGFTIDDANPAFEPPCGVGLDGVAYTRAGFFGAGLFDIGRLEVLRGPQGTTFGKNTTAGVVGLYSKEPTEEFSAKIDLSYQLGEVNYKRAEIAFGGPLFADTVRYRIATVEEDREGYMENTFHETDPEAPQRVGGRTRSGIRGTLLFPDVLGSKIKLIYEETEVESLGNAAKYITSDNSATAQYIRQYDPNADFGENYKTSLLGPQNVPTELRRAHAEWARSFGEWDVTLLGARGELSNTYSLIPAQYPVKWIESTRSGKDPFETLELRTSSPEFDGLFGLDNVFGWDVGSSRFLAGLFYQKAKIEDLDLFVELFHVPTAGIVASSLGVFVPDAVVNNSGAGTSEWAHLKFNQTSNNVAAFAQFTWDFTETWAIDLAGRYSEETKEADWDTSYSDPAPVLDGTGDGGFVANKKLRETNFQPKVSLAWRPIDEVSIYLHWAQAFKSGGFNFYTITGNPEAANPPGRLDFAAESAEDWGLDIKTSLFDNTLRFNLSLFQLVAEDFQVLTEVAGTNIIPYNPTLGVSSVNFPDNYQEVRNAEKATAKGVEVDIQSVPTDWLTLTVAMGYNDTEYNSFADDSCGSNEAANGETGHCDHSGKRFRNTPFFNGTFVFDMRFPVAPLLDFAGDTMVFFGGTVEYTSRNFQDGAQIDDSAMIEPYYRYSAQTGLTNPSQGWTLRLSALNLTDEYQYGFKADGTGAADGQPIRLAAPLPPRTYVASFNWTY